MGRSGERRVWTTVCVVSSLTAISLTVLYLRQRRRKKAKCSDGVPSVQKPQKNFRCVLADNSQSPFVHLRTEESGIGNAHPYDRRIRSLLKEPPPDFLLQRGFNSPPGMEGLYEWIETKEQLEALADRLSKETEFGVDTEQHSFHSLHGFTALVQISTREKDFLVDSIVLHDFMSILQPIFSNPGICKVFHGADNDILWLQRDFHVYVVNLFDTAKACAVLGKQQKSLAYLLHSYCGVITNKAFQRADWRIRPLDKDMVEYARTDAHYLLYIAHQLCLELVQHDEKRQESVADAVKSLKGALMEQAVYRSNLICLQLYEKEGVSTSPATTAASLVSRFYNAHGFPPPSQVDDQLVNLVTSLCEWRDNVARLEDENLRSVLSDTALMALSTMCPTTPDLISSTVSAADASFQASEAALSPIIPIFESPSPVLQQHISELCGIFQRAKLLPSHGAHIQSSVGRIGKSYISGIVERIFSFLNVRKARNPISEACVLTENDDVYHFQEGSAVESWERKIPRSWKRGNSERSRLQFVKKFSCKAPVYHNCRIYADDGRLLCFCDRKKLEWYVRRGLAEIIQEDPPAVRLLFEPKGRPEDESNEFYIQSKSNRCVGCGESSHYLRYRIIPSCYRQHFPEHLKSHRSHDIVLLCVDCHEAAHKAAEKHKRQIAQEFNVPLFAKVMDSDRLVGGKKEAVVVDSGGDEGVSPLQLKNAAMALLRHGSTIPSKRRQELEEVVRIYYGKENITKQDLRAALLVSMGPHERRRWSKKAVGNNGKGILRVLEESVAGGAPSGSQEISSDQGLDTLTSSEMNEDGSKELGAFGGTDVLSLGVSERSSSQRPTNFPNGDCQDLNTAWEEDEDDFIIASPARKKTSNRHKSKKSDSLLGHGIHGRRVVDILMKEEGNEGIRRFCQRWRTVFVEALQPAFLPPGWDVTHSGRREFGDYSVYKPLQDTEEEPST